MALHFFFEAGLQLLANGLSGFVIGDDNKVVATGVADGSLRTESPHDATRALLSLCIDVARWYDPLPRVR